MRNITKAIAIAAMLAFPVASFAQTAPAPAAKQTAAKAEKSTKDVAFHITGLHRSVLGSGCRLSASGPSV